MDELLQGLNEAQRSAVTSRASVLQVLAPPGSGKTKTLTSRAGYLIAEHGLQPRNIIVCTFTVKAAREMQERIAGFLGKDVASRLVLGTFHSIARRYLAVYGTNIGLNEKFGIADSSDTMSIITRITKRENLGIAPAQARSRISALKAQGVSSLQFSQSSKKADQQEFAIVYAEYEEHLRVSNLLDFDDLLVRCVELLRRFPSCVANVEAVLIDEFQDTNNIQFDLMQLFSQRNQNITIVGDPDQSIYGWRNAEIRNLKRMQALYPETHVAKLEENYRSSGAILLSAQEVIEQDQSRPSKRLMPTHSVGMRPVLRKLPNAAAEASWIVSEIRRAATLTGNLLGWNDYAILLRSASLSRHIETAFGKEGIPYRMVGGHKFFERLEVKLLLDYLRVIHHPEHNDAIVRVVNVPSRRIGEATVQKMLEEADAKKTALWKVILDVAQGKSKPPVAISSQAQKGLELFTNLILNSQKKLRDSRTEGATLDAFLGYIIRRVNLEEHIRKTKPEEFDARWANVEELVAQAADFWAGLDYGTEQMHAELAQASDLEVFELQQDQTVEMALAKFLANVSLSADSQKKGEDGERTELVTISTIHAAKGLEWPVVFIPATYEGSIPHSRAEDTDEERRLLYVAMTRAQCLLYLSCPTYNSTGERTTLSNFLAQPPMESYFEKTGPLFNLTSSSELALILHRPQPSKSVVEHALSTYEQLRDDRWPPSGDLNSEDLGLNGEGIRNAYNRPLGANVGLDRPRMIHNNGRVSYTASSLAGATTTMQRSAEYSISKCTMNSTFVSAAMALAASRQEEQVVHKPTQPAALPAPALVPLKRKANASRGNGQGGRGLLDFFSKVPAKAGRPDLVEEGEEPRGARPGDTAHEKVPLKDISNHALYWQGSDENRQEDKEGEEQGGEIRGRPNQAPASKPATTLHLTTMQNRQSAEQQQRKTLGVRRSLGGWAERMAREPRGEGR